jgi:hypothetical protein
MSIVVFWFVKKHFYHKGGGDKFLLNLVTTCKTTRRYNPHFVTCCLFFYAELLLAPTQPPRKRTTPCCLSVSTYSIYSQLPCICGGRPRNHHALVTRGPLNMTASVDVTLYLRLLKDQIRVCEYNAVQAVRLLLKITATCVTKKKVKVFACLSVPRGVGRLQRRDHWAIIGWPRALD